MAERNRLSTISIAGACLGTAIVATIAAVIALAVVIGAMMKPGTDSDDGPALTIVVVSIVGAFPIGALVAMSVGALLVVRDRGRGERAMPLIGAVFASLLPVGLALAALFAAL